MLALGGGQSVTDLLRCEAGRQWACGSGLSSP